MSGIEIALGFLGLVGIGGIVTAVFNKRKELAFKALENKERRYKSCLLYMDVYFEPENIKYLSSRQPDIRSASDVINYLKAEYHEMILYASPTVIAAVKTFIEEPSYDRFLKTALAMRSDLWAKRHDLSPTTIKLDDRDT